jgi:DNA-directed RNA polymerase specialized sigma24 family protein
MPGGCPMSSSPLPPDARTRAADLFSEHAGALLKWLERRYPGVDPDMLSDALVEAILHLSQRPDQFDPDKGDLRAFLRGVARGKLSTLRRGDARRRRREKNKAGRVVTDRPAAANPPLEELIGREELERFRGQIAHTDEERRVLDLMILGVTEPARYAGALGGEDSAELRAKADALRARLRQRVSRHFRRCKQEDPPS